MTDLLQKNENSKENNHKGNKKKKNKLPAETIHTQYNYSIHHGMTVANS